jgi:hypothetical protein
LLCPNPQEFYTKCYFDDSDDNYRIVPGVKSETKVANVLFQNVLQAKNCSWGSSDLTLDAVDITTCSLSVMVEVCQFDLESSFIALMMRKGSSNSLNVPMFMDYYWNELAKEVKAEISVLRWQGDTAGATGTYLDLCDGYEKKFAADTAINDVTGTTVNVSNVIAEMDKVYDSLATNVPACINSDELRFYVSANIYAAYKRAVAAGNTNAYITESLQDSYLGIPVIVTKALSSNTMVLTKWSNLIYAVDGEDDNKNLKAINLMETVAEPVIRTRTDLKVGFNYVNPGEIVFYS